METVIVTLFRALRFFALSSAHFSQQRSRHEPSAESLPRWLLESGRARAEIDEEKAKSAVFKPAICIARLAD